MDLAHKPTKLVITGASGTGKSTFLERYVDNSFRSPYSHIFIFDHQGEFAFRLNTQPALTVEQLEQSLESGFVIFDPSGIFPGETEAAWNFFCEWCFEFSRLNLQTGTKLLVCDEMQVMSSTSEQPFEMSLVLETGRRYRLDFAGISQQYNLLHNRTRNQATDMIVFRATDKLVLDALEKKGFPASEVQALPDGSYIWRNFRTGEEKRGKINLATNGQKPSEVAENSAQTSVDEEPENEGNSHPVSE